eukprot:4133706-Pyramimonas_sp.AAC.1
MDQSESSCAGAAGVGVGIVRVCVRVCVCACACLDGELGEGADVVVQYVHQPDRVRESHRYVQPVR